MRTIYIRRLNGEVEACPDNTYVTFLANGMVKVDAPYQAYLIDKSNLEIIADSAKELLDNGT
jgi:hypothetical protein